jgi:hypothetical protein
MDLHSVSYPFLKIRLASAVCEENQAKGHLAEKVIAYTQSLRFHAIKLIYSRSIYNPMLVVCGLNSRCTQTGDVASSKCLSDSKANGFLSRQDIGYNPRLDFG